MAHCSSAYLFYPHDLLKGHALLRSLNDKNRGRFGYSCAGQACSSRGLRLRGGSREKHCCQRFAEH